MTDSKKYYKIMGLDKDATEKDIKKTYRKLALQYHPDKNPGNQEAEEMFKKISEAYQVLSDSAKRAEYDNTSLSSPFVFSRGHGFNPFTMFNNFQRTHAHNVNGINFSTSFGSNVQFTSTSTQTTIRDGKRIVTTIHTSNGKTTKTIEEFPM